MSVKPEKPNESLRVDRDFGSEFVFFEPAGDLDPVTFLAGGVVYIIGGFPSNKKKIPMGGGLAGSALAAGLGVGGARRPGGRHPHTDEAFASA